MTELNDHLKLLYSRGARLYCRGCGRLVRRDTVQSIVDELIERASQSGDPRVLITFPVAVPANFSVDEVLKLLEQQGYTRIHARERDRLDVVQDRLRIGGADRSRIAEALEAALRVGRGRVDVHVLPEGSTATAPASSTRVADARADAPPPAVWRFSTDLHCPDCD